MGAIKDLWNSERGLLAVLIIIATTVLTGIGRMTVEMWQQTTLYIFGIYAAGKTITGAVGMFTGTGTEPAAPAAAPAAPAAAPTAAVATAPAPSEPAK
jgi:hypothetical protein